ncbi:hypothetical protein O181_130018 [Austropuccinia psidii MF-1]|uniref:Uncharacterized protein n=1 Tax=Austropuccinia psidii MF-1 TaxID=1389203 RepID=A0A9Q3KZ90_9BASI|nr:hypothetical protein [Austropuccinia psidii MF-1]
MPSTRSGASYTPQAALKKGYRSHHGRKQLVTEGQGSVNEIQTYKLCHSEADNTVLPSNRAETSTRSLCGHIQSQQEGLQQFLSDLWKNCMNLYLTVRMFLGHPKTCKLLDGWHPLMEKKNIILLTEEWRGKKPPPPKQFPKTA